MTGRSLVYVHLVDTGLVTNKFVIIISFNTLTLIYYNVSEKHGVIVVYDIYHSDDSKGHISLTR
jgi:hypothetical protein